MINRFVDVKTKSSAVEAEMDKMVESVEKTFSKHMSQIASKCCKHAPSDEIGEEDEIEASKRIQARKWFGSARSKPDAEEINNEVRTTRAQQKRESEAVEVAGRFQDRFKKINTNIRTFEGREKAKKAAAERDAGSAKSQ